MVALFEKIYDREPIFTVVSVIGEDLLHRCFNEGFYVKIVTLPNIDAVLANNYCLQILKTGFAEQF